MASPLNLYVVTFNCGRELIDSSSFSVQILRPYKDQPFLPDLIVLCLQELAPLAYAFLGGSFVAPYFTRIISSVQDAVTDLDADQGYQAIFVRNAGLTGLVILAKRDLVPNVRWIESAEVGVGRSQTGNKGAAGARLLYSPRGITPESDDVLSLTFVAAHLYPYEDGIARRNQDWEEIVKGLAFIQVPERSAKPTMQSLEDIEDGDDNSPLLRQGRTAKQAASKPSGMFQKGSLVFFAGDLNYRTGSSAPQQGDIATFPQPTLDENDPKHYSNLWPRDQLSREHKAGRTLHGLSEAPVNFPPTYKYSTKQQKIAAEIAKGDSGESSTWSWSPHRWPSWCDRVFFSSFLAEDPQNSPLKVLSYQALACQPTSDHRPVAFACQLDVDALTLSKLNTQLVGTTSFESPFRLNSQWAEDRAAARVKELIIGTLAYLAWTWEGHGLLLATIGGAVGGWLIMRSLIP